MRIRQHETTEMLEQKQTNSQTPEGPTIKVCSEEASTHSVKGMNIDLLHMMAKGTFR